MTVASILESVGTFITQMWSWIGTGATNIVESPLLLILLVGMPVGAFVINWIIRLVKRGAR